jgi:hypothetical protein
MSGPAVILFQRQKFLAAVTPALAVPTHLQLVRDAINVTKMLLPGFDYLEQVRSISRVVTDLHCRVLKIRYFLVCVRVNFCLMRVARNVFQPCLERLEKRFL